MDLNMHLGLGMRKLIHFFFQQGFIKSKSDPNLYIKKDRNGHIALISLYVDDLIIRGSATKLIEEIKKSCHRNLR
jgi:hypothetical protein